MPDTVDSLSAALSDRYVVEREVDGGGTTVGLLVLALSPLVLAVSSEAQRQAVTESATLTRAVLSTTSVPSADSSAAPLFESHDLLTLNIEAPLETIFHDRSQDSEESPGILSYQDPGGTAVSIPVDIRTRGMARLQPRICEFPPLRLDFPSAEVEGTLFANQDKLKLVTHCQDNRSAFEQYVLQEYLIYRTYNLLTEMSFRVRLARITYTDTDGDRDTVTRYGFLIEDEDRLAERNGWEVLHCPQVPPDVMEPVQLALLELFQYMIGNTDWSAFAKEANRSECCHNAKPIGDVAVGPVFAVPYDFDITGVISTRYANRLFRENLERLGLRSVRDRLYKGRCASLPYLEQTFQLFNEKKDSIYAVYRSQDGLEEDILEKSLEYLDEFYEIINDQDKAQREIVRNCRRI